MLLGNGTAVETVTYYPCFISKFCKWGWSNLQYQLLQKHDNPQPRLHFRGCNQMVVCLFPFLLSSIASIYDAHFMSRAWHYSLASIQAPKEDVWQETPPYLWDIPSLNGSVTLKKKHGRNLLVTWSNWWFPGESIEFCFFFWFGNWLQVMWNTQLWLWVCLRISTLLSVEEFYDLWGSDWNVSSWCKFTFNVSFLSICQFITVQPVHLFDVFQSQTDSRLTRPYCCFIASLDAPK